MLRQKYKIISNDMNAEENQFLNEIVSSLTIKTDGELKLTDLAAVIDCGPVMINQHIRSIMRKTEYVKKHGMEAGLDIFREKMITHLNQAIENNITHISGIPIMLVSISSVPIFADHPVKFIPGCAYHRDGGGRPVTTKITQTEERKWQGGELHLAHFQADSELIGKSSDIYPGEEIECLNQCQSIIFNNQQLLHAVNPYLTTQITTRRTIYQERLNMLGSFDTNLLTHFGPIPIPLPSVSILSSYLARFINPVILPKRDRKISEMTPDELEYITNNETPSHNIRTSLIDKHGDDFQTLAQQLDDDGVLILPQLLTEDILKSLQTGFENEINKKIIDKQLQQTSFNAVVDVVEKDMQQAVSQLSNNTTLQALIQYHLGQKNIALASWRGYRQEPRESMHYRAWDWHNDQKALGPYGELKIMILLTDLDKDGQAMRVMPGSHKRHWNMPSQKFTKYHFDEAISFSSKDTQTTCYGKAGTVIIFDTNMVHSGFRNLSQRRDVITINFVPALQNSPIMFSDKTAIINSLTQAHVNPNEWKELRNNAVKTQQDSTKTEIGIARDEYYDHIPRFENAKKRFAFENDSVFFDEFLIQAIQADLSADLDLPIRYGAHDVERDKQFVAFRDAGQQHAQYQRLCNKIKSMGIEIDFSIDIDQATSYIKNVISHPDIIQASEDNLSIKRTLRLLNDLLIAINQNDTKQRLRTNLIYIYFSFECIWNTITNDSSSVKFFVKQNNSALQNDLNEKMNKLIKMYVSTVYLDDLNFKNQNSNKMCRS